MRFTIRDLLWLTLLAAVLVAWWVDRGRLARELAQFRGPFKRQVQGQLPGLPIGDDY
jgi:hypothetical protein